MCGAAHAVAQPASHAIACVCASTERPCWSPRWPPLGTSTCTAAVAATQHTGVPYEELTCCPSALHRAPCARLSYAHSAALPHARARDGSLTRRLRPAARRPHRQHHARHRTPAHRHGRLQDSPPLQPPVTTTAPPGCAVPATAPHATSAATPPASCATASAAAPTAGCATSTPRSTTPPSGPTAWGGTRYPRSCRSSPP